MIWDAEETPAWKPLTPAEKLRAYARAAVLIVWIFGGLALLLLVRLIERPLFGLHRPWTPWITQAVCRGNFFILGMRHEVKGCQMRQKGAIVANHASWLDIFTLNAGGRLYFVSKDEVKGWPGIGWLARATGTVFIRRERAQARAQKQLFEERLTAGHKLLFFPEGTSTDGLRVLPFKTTLFEAFFTKDLREELYVQPVTMVYRAPEGRDARFYGWWGDMGFGPSLMQVLALRRPGAVTVVYHAPLKVSDFADRKALAKTCEEAVRSAMPSSSQP